MKRDEHKVIKNLNLKIPKGQIVGLLGINGAGKTTTIKMLTTLLSTTTGNIYIDGIDSSKNPTAAKRKVNIISGGERNLYWRLSGKENLEYFGALYGVPKKKLSVRIEKILEIVDLTAVSDIPVEKYSKGMKQRLQIARGLINNPDYLFLDEPTLGLDILIAKELRAYIKKLSSFENKGILLTSHYIGEVEELCDYIYILNNGYIQSEGTSSQIKNSYNVNEKIIITVDLLHSSFVTKLKNIRGIVFVDIISKENKTIKILSNHSIKKEIIMFLELENITLLNLEVSEPNLEEVLLYALEA